MNLPAWCRKVFYHVFVYRCLKAKRDAIYFLSVSDRSGWFMRGCVSHRSFVINPYSLEKPAISLWVGLRVPFL